MAAAWGHLELARLSLRQVLLLGRRAPLLRAPPARLRQFAELALFTLHFRLNDVDGVHPGGRYPAHAPSKQDLLASVLDTKLQ